MNFVSPVFVFFLSFVVLMNYYLPQKYKSLILLFASFLFVAYFNLQSLAVVVLFILFNFYISFKISQSKTLYFLSVLINVLPILVYNYFNSNSIFSFEYINNWALALGVLFYSLQNIAYQTEIYLKRIQPEPSILNYSLYIAYFPKFITGPIMLPNEFLPQINSSTKKILLIEGFNRFLIGLLKKMVLADRLAPAVHSVFDFSDSYSGLTTLTGVYFYTIQLYFNFSGFMDMSIGISKMLGYDLKENFSLPFRATSISEFWRRWHISLMNFLYNYIYYPAAYYFRKQKKWAIVIAIAITFLVSGIWHGLGVSFMIWASFHMLFMVYEAFTKKIRLGLSQKINPFIYNAISIFIVFNLVCLTDIFLRAGSYHASLQIFENIFNNFFPNNFLTDFVAPLAVGGHQLEQFNFMVTIFFVFAFLLFEKKIFHFSNSSTFNILFALICLLIIVLFGVFNAGERFIYMQF